ncbi:MAG: phenylalanine--tRNA ligase subunit alpha, partial [Prolixibacteraceae bacterium]|nr:phenylalanine--tRNA ligase subunit alpha [Prolixibacteraceae bacterium]
MLEKIKALQDEIAAIVANNKDEAEALRIKYLSKKGKIGDLFGEFKNVPVDQKKAVGAAINDLKNFAQDKINSLKASFDQKRSSAEGIDLSLPGDSIKLGSRHPLAVVRNEIIDIFARLGFVVSEGPEMEDDWHVFSALNFPPEHPARDMQDTFFIEKDPDIVLRTHTSSVQVRVMEKTQPPIRAIFPGRVFRNEAISYRAH